MRVRLRGLGRAQTALAVALDAFVDFGGPSRCVGGSGCEKSEKSAMRLYEETIGRRVLASGGEARGEAGSQGRRAKQCQN